MVKDKNKNNQVAKDNTHNTSSTLSLIEVTDADGVRNENNKGSTAPDNNRSIKNNNTNTNGSESVNSNSSDESVHVKSNFKPITPKNERPTHRPRSYYVGDGFSVNATAGSVPI